MLLQRHASKACAMKMAALSRPKIAVTVSIIIIVQTPPRAKGPYGPCTVKMIRDPERTSNSADDSRQQVRWIKAAGFRPSADAARSSRNGGCGGSPGRIRTSDQPVNSRLLYH